MSELFVNTSVANLHREPSFQSEMVTQAVLWEKLDVLDRRDNWINVRQNDGYVSWINEFYTISAAYPAHLDSLVVNHRFLAVYAEPDNGSNEIGQLVFGTRVPITEHLGDWYKIQYPSDNSGWIKIPDISCGKNRSSIVQTAGKMLGVPYFWGGKTALGYDCSGFVQDVFRFCGYKLPRDSSLQRNFLELNSIKLEEAEPGDLVFFQKKNVIVHVAICLGEGEIIHSSGCVKTNSLIEGNIGFDPDLREKMDCCKSINQLIQLA